MKPSETSHEAQQEHLEEFAEEMHKAHEADAATHHADGSSSSALGGILTLVGAILVLAVTLPPNGPVTFTHEDVLYSIGRALLWWGPVALLLVAGVLVLTSGRLMRAMAGGLAVGVTSVVLLLFVYVLFGEIDFGAPIGWRTYLGLVGSAVALAGGLIAFLAARTKT